MNQINNKKNKDSLKFKALSIFSIIVFFLVWQLVSSFKIIDPIFIGTPSLILKEGIDLFKTGEIYEHLFSSVTAFFFGFSLAVLFGIFGGIFIGTKKVIYYILSPFIFALNAIPLIVLLPLIIVWLGIGVTAKIFVIFMMSTVPILVNTIDASKSVDASLVKMAKSFRASNFFILRSIIFFHSLPSIISGIKIAVGRGLIGLLLAEFLGLGKGIGYLIAYYGTTFQVDKLMALVLLILIFSATILKTLNFLEKKYIKWKNV